MVQARKIDTATWVIEADGEEVAHVVAMERHDAVGRASWWYGFDDEERGMWPSLRSIVAEVERRMTS